MPLPVRLLQRFGERKPLLDKVVADGKATVQAFCDQQGYAFVSRVKDPYSIAEKIETGRFASWSDLDDIFACAIIVPTIAHEANVITFCERAFQTTIRRRGQTRRSPEVFRFDTTIVVARFREPLVVSGVEISTSDIPFESQIRTAFDHAWSVATHALVYKAGHVDWARYRVAAQIKAVVEQLDSLLVAFDDVLPYVQQNPYDEVSERVRVAQVVDEWFLAKLLPKELRPRDMSRFADNFCRLCRAAKDSVPVDAALAAIGGYLKSEQRVAVAMSVSLLQFFVAVLAGDGVLKAPFRKYRLHVTEELEAICPAVRGMGPTFNYEG